MALILGSALTGCADYMNHRDSVTLAAGNAPETNLAIHTIKPFPPEAWNTTIIADGKAVDNAQATYDNRGRGATAIPVFTKTSTTISSTSTTISTGGSN